jgi:two-component system LytT family sensor kinase
MSTATTADRTSARTGSDWLSRFGVIIACWTFVGLLFLAQTWVLNAASSNPQPFGVVWFQNFAVFGLWVLLTPLVLELGARFPLERTVPWPRNAAWHFLCSIAVALLHALAHAFLARMVLAQAAAAPADQLVLGLLISTSATNVLLYWAVLAVGQGLRYFRYYQDGEARLTAARLQSLRRQLDPHFLFNALNAIAEVGYRDSALADRLISRLASLLRDSLDSSDLQERPLARELDFVQGYLDIQHALLGPRLRSSIDAAPEALSGLVPVMLLQTLVENSVRHGLAPSAAGGAVRLRAWKRDGRLKLEIKDDGLGADPSRLAGGIGIANTRARLAHLHGPDHLIEFDTAPGRGTHIHIDIPFRTEAQRG